MKDITTFKGNMKLTNYLERMNPKDITDCPCANCLKDTEDMIRCRNFDGVSAGDRLWYETYAAETHEFVRVLRQYSPSTILDVGSGYGRVIEVIHSALPSAKIIGTEIDNATYGLAQQRFAGTPNVRIELCDVVKYLANSNRSFDMATCLMNTYGNINDESLFVEILRHAHYFVFSLYNPLYDKDRAAMYHARCHLKFRFEGQQYMFSDPWSNVVVSRSYNHDQITALVKKANADIVEMKEVGILNFCVAKRKILK